MSKRLKSDPEVISLNIFREYYCLPYPHIFADASNYSFEAMKYFQVSLEPEVLLTDFIKFTKVLRHSYGPVWSIGCGSNF